jgi:hypothetical protein
MLLSNEKRKGQAETSSTKRSEIERTNKRTHKQTNKTNQNIKQRKSSQIKGNNRKNDE